MKMLIFILSCSVSSMFSEEIFWPEERQVIEIKYGTEPLSISRNDQFITLWIIPESSSEKKCSYKVAYGTIEIGNNGSGKRTIISRGAGIFDDKNDAIIWPGKGGESGKVTDVFIKWSSRNDESGYLYVPMKSRISIGFEVP